MLPIKLYLDNNPYSYPSSHHQPTLWSASPTGPLSPSPSAISFGPRLCTHCSLCHYQYKPLPSSHMENTAHLSGTNLKARPHRFCQCSPPVYLSYNGLSRAILASGNNLFGKDDSQSNTINSRSSLYIFVTHLPYYIIAPWKQDNTVVTLVEIEFYLPQKGSLLTFFPLNTKVNITIFASLKQSLKNKVKYLQYELKYSRFKGPQDA